MNKTKKRCQEPFSPLFFQILKFALMVFSFFVFLLETVKFNGLDNICKKQQELFNNLVLIAFS
jgi:hypothetical protein